jgi:hypothetical protein
MPYGGNDWLALTQEPILEPEIAICDPHHHFWDFRSARIPYQRYLLHELVADVDYGHNVRSTVFIEARAMYRPGGPVEMRPVGEVEFVQGLAAASASGLYGPCRAASAIVGHADLKLADRVEPVLEALQAASPNRFRGIRHTVRSKSPAAPARRTGPLPRHKGRGGPWPSGTGKNGLASLNPHRRSTRRRAGYVVFSGNSPGISRDARAAGSARRNGARELSEASTPLSIKADTTRRP